MLDREFRFQPDPVEWARVLDGLAAAGPVEREAFLERQVERERYLEDYLSRLRAEFNDCNCGGGGPGEIVWGDSFIPELNSSVSWDLVGIFGNDRLLYVCTSTPTASFFLWNGVPVECPDPGVRNFPMIVVEPNSDGLNIVATIWITGDVIGADFGCAVTCPDGDILMVSPLRTPSATPATIIDGGGTATVAPGGAFAVSPMTVKINPDGTFDWLRVEPNVSALSNSNQRHCIAVSDDGSKFVVGITAYKALGQSVSGVSWVTPGGTTTEYFGAILRCDTATGTPELFSYTYNLRLTASGTVSALAWNGNDSIVVLLESGSTTQDQGVVGPSGAIIGNLMARHAPGIYIIDSDLEPMVGYTSNTGSALGSRLSRNPVVKNGKLYYAMTMSVPNTFTYFGQSVNVTDLKAISSATSVAGCFDLTTGTLDWLFWFPGYNAIVPIPNLTVDSDGIAYLSYGYNAGPDPYTVGATTLPSNFGGSVYVKIDATGAVALVASVIELTNTNDAMQVSGRTNANKYCLDSRGNTWTVQKALNPNNLSFLQNTPTYGGGSLTVFDKDGVWLNAEVPQV